jgi:hypothetical protein
MRELLPCPFCGSDAEHIRDGDHHGEFFKLGCSNKKCPAHILYYTELIEHEPKAIAAWNRRAALAQPAGEPVAIATASIRDGTEVSPTAYGYATLTPGTHKLYAAPPSLPDERATETLASALNAFNLALEYWAHRQQRYTNRHPVWVQEAKKAQEAIREALKEQAK